MHEEVLLSWIRADMTAGDHKPPVLVKVGDAVAGRGARTCVNVSVGCQIPAELVFPDIRHTIGIAVLRQDEGIDETSRAILHLDHRHAAAVIRG